MDIKSAQSIRLLVSLAAGLLLISSAHAVRVTDGRGQALIFPIYSTERLDTLMTVTNHSAATKGIFLIFREADLGVEVLSFYAYLAPHDTFRFTISDLVRLGVGDFPGILVPAEDQTCTVPEIPLRSLDLPGVNYQMFFPFLISSFGGTQDSASSGYVEVLEVGEVDGSINPRDCDALVARWTSGGVWDRNPEADVSPPAGDLSGRAWLIDVLAGESYVYQATALDDYRTDPLPGPGGTPNSVMNSAQSTTALIRQDGADRVVNFDNSFAAVSAALSRSALALPVVVDDRLGGRTDIVLTMPSFFQAVVEPLAADDAPRAPFLRPSTRAFVDFELLDQDGRSGIDCPSQSESQSLNDRRMVLQHAVTVIPVGGPVSGGITGTQTPPLLWSGDTTRAFTDFSSGRDGELVVRTTDRVNAACDGQTAVADEHVVTSADSADQVFGLPIIATSLTRIRNGTLSGGSVLANYGGAHPGSYMTSIESQSASQTSADR